MHRWADKGSTFGEVTKVCVRCGIVHRVSRTSGGRLHRVVWAADVDDAEVLAESRTGPLVVPPCTA